jgi:DNA-binding transcriptional ArsR family regulator
MLEQLFGSKTRTKLLRLFFMRKEARFYVREITRLIDERINSVRRELENLKKFGLIKDELVSNKRYYFLNEDFTLLKELKDLVIKSRFFVEKEYTKKFKKLPGVKYVALTGYFVGLKEKTLTDVLIVGKVSKTKVESMINTMSKEFLNDVNYTIMDMKEYKYRKGMTDKFLYNILKNKKIVIIDTLGTEENN